MTVTRDDVLRELLGGLWHTTHPDRFEMILRSAAILPEPDIPDNERWSTFEGPKFYPYVRTIGGVSLFDFDGFEPENYGRKYPMSSWSYFVPYRTEILDAYLFESLAEVQALTERWLLMYNHKRPHDSLGLVPPLTFLPRPTSPGESPVALST